ncbi:MAG: protease complex subunit PrcB family protein [Candidatus Aenigmarchaeota archaeon]|nr:protease complex subunit PrcB family protein [Candidatus Aenigmarchaeota archaeon]
MITMRRLYLLAAVALTAILAVAMLAAYFLPVARQESRSFASSLAAALSAAGMEVQEVGTLALPYFEPRAKVLAVNGQDVQVFEYASPAEVATAAGQVAPDGTAIAGKPADWPEPARFYRKGNAIVLYVGRDPAVRAALETQLGQPFAASPSLTTLAKGVAFSGPEDASLYAINSSAGLKTAWARANQGYEQLPSMPTIDFTQQQVLAAFLGQRPSSGYYAEIYNVTVEDAVTRVYVRETTPGKGCIVFQSLTYPFHLATVAVSDKPAVFTTEAVARNC